MSDHNTRGDLIVALRNEIARLHADAGGKELMIAALSETLKECADELAAWVEWHYALMLNYPSQKRRFERDMGPVLRARVLLSHPTTEPAKAEET